METDDPALLPYLMNRLVSRMNQVWLETIRAYGLTVPRWQLLSILVAMEGTTVRQLVAMSGLEQPVLTRVLDQMIRDGLAIKKTNPDDARSRLVYPTGKGRDTHTTLLPAAQQFIGDLFGPMEDSERREMVRKMSGLITRLEERD